MDYRTHLQHLKSSGICPFCREQEFAIDRNEHAFVLLARAPYQKDHLLVCPYQHGELISDYSDKQLAGIMELVFKWERLLYTHHQEVVVFLRQGKVGGTTGKSISHLHWHIVPHFQIIYGGSQEGSDARIVYDEQEYTKKSTEFRASYVI